jgi:hypothetical protein
MRAQSIFCHTGVDIVALAALLAVLLSHAAALAQKLHEDEKRRPDQKPIDLVPNNLR